MSQTVQVGGINYTIPDQGDPPNWGTNLTAFFVALAAEVATAPPFFQKNAVNSTPITVATEQTYLVASNSITATLNLPAPVLNLWFAVKDSGNNAATNNITIHRFGSEQINGVAADKVLNVSGGFWMFGCDGTNWYMLRDPDTYKDFPGIANPPSPAAGTARFHASTNNGFTRFEQDNEAPTNLIVCRDNVFIAKNTSGSPMTAGQSVYVTGSTGNVPNIALAKSNAIATLPAVGVCLDPIGNNSFGQVMKTGIISNIDTSAFLVGASLWVSATTAGAFTSTRPAIPNLAQRVATVLVSGVGNGSLLIVTAPFIGGLDSGTTAAGWSVPGDVSTTVAGKGIVVTTPDGLHTYRLAVDNNGIMTTEQIT